MKGLKGYFKLWQNNEIDFIPLIMQNSAGDLTEQLIDGNQGFRMNDLRTAPIKLNKICPLDASTGLRGRCPHRTLLALEYLPKISKHPKLTFFHCLLNSLKGIRKQGRIFL